MGTNQQKCLIPICGVSLLEFVVRHYFLYTENFIFVVGYQAEKVIEVIKALPIKSQVVYQKEPKGIADALLCTRDIVPDQFIVALGDCFLQGQMQVTRPLAIGVSIKASKEITKQNYRVSIDFPYVSHVKEKPTIVTAHHYCGMGLYFFDRRVFHYIERTPPSALRNEIEITDVLQTMIDNGEAIRPAWFAGDYINVNTPEDIRKVEASLKCGM